MATYDLTQTEVNALLSTGNLDVDVKNSVLNFLFDPDNNNSNASDTGIAAAAAHSQADDDTITVQVSDGTQPLNPHADLLNLTAANASVTTSGQLDAIVQNVSG